MTDDTKHILTLDQEMRAITEIVADAGPEGMAEDDLMAGVNAVRELAICAGLFELWNAGDTSLSWNCDTKDLVWQLAKDTAGAARTTT